MGCTESKFENDESAARCKKRKHFIKSAFTARNAFAAAHSAYSMSLKNTGAALSDFAQGEVHDLYPSSSTVPLSSPAATSAAQTTLSSSSPATSVGTTASAVQPPVDNLPPPPPPLPADLSLAAPLQRAASMPGLPISNIRGKGSTRNVAIVEEGHPETITEDSEVDAVDDGSPAPVAPTTSSDSVPPKHFGAQPAPPHENTWDYFNVFNTEHIPAPSLDQPEEETLHKEAETFANTVKYPSPSAPATVIPEKAVADPPPTPQQKTVIKPRQSSGSSHHHRSASSGGVSEGKRGKMTAAVPQSVSFLQIVNQLDDHFLKAYQSAHEVSKMLEATRLHYHSNFADNRGHIDHSEKILKVITWNRSIKGIQSEVDVKDDLDDEKWETHATVLDKMLAWEKKLYDEFKAGELMKVEYQRKIHLLNKQKKHGAPPESLEKIKATVSQLHTRYIVDMQSMDSTILEINSLRDHKLYPKLVELVGGMAAMWETMHVQHSSQHKLVAGLRASDLSVAPRGTSEEHHDTTIQLWQVVREWQSQFQNLVTHQKEYIQALNNWLRLNLVPIESSLKESGSTPPRPINKPPIQDLLHAWHDHLEKLPDGIPKNAIYSFSEVINTIVILQEDELKLKERCEETKKEYLRKKRYFEDWHRKYVERTTTSSTQEAKQRDSSEATTHKDLVEEKKFAVESLEIRLKSEEETYLRTCKQVREKSLGSIRNHLPELFRAMSDFSFACSEMYKQLRIITQTEKPIAAD
ncbi:hypothetical protein KSP39_PZI013918 [Platanthera zijinensis]|uniref:Nitrate regulatory gene2 protein-like n=1 Tax=Platanthera zijinensis TaxID=2320716 RepID=A0AAP0G3P3_9ASPA